jgi:4-oxalocrotonate tautomerase family enzyme
MPVLHVYVPEGSLNEPQKKKLFEGLTRAVLRGEGAPDTPRARAVTWVFLHETPKGTWAVGGVASSFLRFLVEIDLPQGSLNDRRRKRMAAGIAKVLTDVVGRNLPPVDSLVKIQEIIDGDWSAGGQVFRLRDLAEFVKKS